MGTKSHNRAESQGNEELGSGVHRAAHVVEAVPVNVYAEDLRLTSAQVGDVILTLLEAEAATELDRESMVLEALARLRSIQVALGAVATTLASVRP